MDRAAFAERRSVVIEAIAANDVRAATEAIEAAQRHTSSAVPAGRDDSDSPAHWQAILEANAAAVLEALELVTLPAGYAVRYRFFERVDNELRVRPFVARASTDVDPVRAVLQWHPAPGASPAAQARGNRDVDLLYRHFSFADSALGVFQYWLAMQEIWASSAWVHSRVVADRQHFAELVGTAEWLVERELESHQPLVIRRPHGANLAVLLYSPLQRHSIELHQVEINADNSLTFAAPLTVASGPRGYLA